MAPSLPATLVHRAVFSTSSALVASPVLGLARQLVNTAGSLPARPFSWSSRCRGGDRSGQAARHHSVRPWSLMGSQCFWADPSLSPPSTAFFRLPLRLARLAHSPRSRRRHSSNSHSVRAAARGLARSGVYEIAFAVLAATVVPNDLVETSRLSGTRRAQPKKLRECDPAHTMSRRRSAYLSSSASRPRVGGVRALWRAPF